MSQALANSLPNCPIIEKIYQIYYIKLESPRMIGYKRCQCQITNKDKALVFRLSLMEKPNELDRHEIPIHKSYISFIQPSIVL